MTQEAVMANRAVAIVSGGLDSTTMLWSLAKSSFTDIHCLSFDYGQRHKKELQFAQRSAERFGFAHDIIDLTQLTRLLATSGSSLVATADVPEGHYAELTMKQTVVPNRNMMMLAIAGAVAVAEERPCVAIGVHKGDHFIYPDCRTEFINLASTALEAGNEGFGYQQRGAYIIAPYLQATKEDIAYEALMLGLPLEWTWSCYKGGEYHCGRCGTCVERLEAIDGAQRRARRAGVTTQVDATVYEDTEFWKTETAKAHN